jgi:DNA-binding CsgD family transcriptional regulator
LCEPHHLLGRITADPRAPLVAAVTGVGGTGKSTLLRAVARAYRTAGAAAPGTEGGPVLVDDAHLLGAATLRRLEGLAGCGSRLVVAFRPWPDGPGLTALRAAVARHGVTVTLGPLPPDAVRVRLADLLGEDPNDQLVGLVHEQSAGLPLLVDTVAAALAGPPGRRRLAGTPLPPALVERLRHIVDAVPPDARLVLEALAAGAGLEVDLLATVTGLSPEGLPAAVEAARATGLVDAGTRPVPFARALLLAAAPVLRMRELQRGLAATQLRRRGPVLPAARRMLDTGATGAGAAAAFEAAADEALPRSPALAAELFTAAVAAGGDPAVTAARRCAAAALSGDLEGALRMADLVLADSGPEPDRVLAVATAAAVLAHRGFPARSAALAAGLPADHVTGPVWAVPTLLAVGDAAGARSVLARARAAEVGAGLARDAGALVAAALLEAVDGAPARALAGLTGAAVLMEPVAATTLLPDTPAALTALVALQAGDAGVADAALRRAAAGHHGGRPAQVRHLLLHGWVLLTRGRFRAAQEAFERATASGRLQPRDELLAAALQVALARRAGGAAALTAGWARARTALLHHPVDLHTLLPLGELAVAAALLHDDRRLTPHFADAHRVLARLGDPALWAAPLYWFEAQAAVAAGRQDAADRCVERLDAAAPHGVYPAALAAAARCWVSVRWGQVEQASTVAAAQDLGAAGLPWEGAKLAGQAAARSDDRGVAAALHACARELFRSTDSGDGTEVTEGAAPGGEPVLPAPPREGPGLSERELEVGRLILAGLTYKQIGEELYISAKTVENHVARMRRRLGAGTRNELFDRLRALGALEAS